MSFEANNDLPFLPSDDIKEEIDEIIPERCDGCGVQCELAAQLARVLITKHMMTRVAESLIGEPGEEFDAILERSSPSEEAADQLKRFTREATASSLDEFDQEISEMKKEMITNSSACTPPLKMRASKDGVTYTVNVCTSPRQYHDSKDIVPTYIQTRFKES